MALIAAFTLQRSYRHRRWLESIIPWADAEERDVSMTTIKLFRAALLAIGTPQDLRSEYDRDYLQDRLTSISDDLLRFMDRAGRRPDGPSSLAVARCTQVISLVAAQIERWRALNV